MKKIDDQCAGPPLHQPLPNRPSVSPIYPAAVYLCEDADQADSLMAGQSEGYFYQRDGHPNADQFAEVCCRLHGAQVAAVTSSGMAALSLALLSMVQPGDHLVISNQLYGRTRLLLGQEANRLGINTTEVDTCNLAETAAAMRPETRMVVVETITNPLLRVSDIEGLSKIAHDSGAMLLVDNTFATPAICQPLSWGADLVMESVSKLINGHGDLMLGLLCGSRDRWERVSMVQAAWGFTSSPMDCWLAQRGLSTLHLRSERASENAQVVAEFLALQKESNTGRIVEVAYPGLVQHVDHELAIRQFSPDSGSISGDDTTPIGFRSPVGFGSMVTFDLRGDWETANQFIRLLRDEIPFCPSLGEIPTTLSHPASTSHRGLSAEQRSVLGITDSTIRLSIGVQSAEFIVSALEKALGALDL